MTHTVLAAGPLPGNTLAALEAKYVVHQRKALTPDLSGQIEVVVGTALTELGADLINTLPRLKLIALFGVGYDKVDLNAVRRRNIALTNTPEVMTDDVADIAMALILAVVRRIGAADAFVRAGKWRDGRMPLAHGLRGRRLGIVGMGRIGRAVAKRAEAFGLMIAYHGPHQKADVTYPYHPTVIELARAVDIIVLCAPGGSTTHHLIDAPVLEALGPEGVLINVARGSLVDEDALIQALMQETLGGAGLDVFAREPNVPEELLRLDNVVLLPHIGSATVESRQAMEDLFLANIAAFFEGQPLLTPADL